MTKRILPNTISIQNIKRGGSRREHILYAALVDSRNGNLLISATLDYIYDQIEESSLVSPETYDSLIRTT